MAELKWYIWDGSGEIPTGVTQINVQGLGVISDSKLLSDANTWKKLGKGDDIISYTLGEPLRDSILIACDKVLEDLDKMTPEELQAKYDSHENGPIGLALQDAQEFLYGKT